MVVAEPSDQSGGRHRTTQSWHTIDTIVTGVELVMEAPTKPEAF
jgi:hypothetical protein